MTRRLALSAPQHAALPWLAWLRKKLPGAGWPGDAKVSPSPSPLRLLLMLRRRCPVWLYRLLIILAYLLALIATLLWKEAVFRHSFRISVAAGVKYLASWLVAWFQTGESKLSVFVGLLDLSLYAFVTDIVIEILEEQGIPVRKMLRDLYRYMFQRPRREGWKPRPRRRPEAKTDEPPPPAAVEGHVEVDKTEDVTPRAGDNKPPRGD